MLHRVGSAARSPPLVRAAVTSQSDAAIGHPIRLLGQGEEIIMSDAVSESSEVTTAKQSPVGGESVNEATPRTAPAGRQTGLAARAAPFPITQNGAVAALSQQGCACGGSEPAQMVYALGSLWFDFGTEARHDAFVQQLGYPIQPDALFNFLSEGEGLEHKPKFLTGLTSEHLVEAFKRAKKKDPTEAEVAGFANYLNRIYYQMRNLGVAPQERALNFAATNAYQAGQAFEKAFEQGGDQGAPPMLFLQGITPQKSPICRPDSDCWDVEITFFDPVNTNRSALYYRFTVDVSEVLPVTIGKPRWWWAPN
jgi:hypothetical protein